MIVKCVQANECPCQAANILYTSGWPSENCCNRGPTRSPTAPMLTTIVSQKIEENQDAAPTLCQATPLVFFHPDTPAFSPRILMRGAKWPALLARADTAHADQARTETAAPNHATPAAVRSGYINSNL